MSTQGQTVEESNDWMALEPRLMELIKAAVEGISPKVHVMNAADLASVQEAAQHTPAIHLIYGGYRVAEGQLNRWRLVHTWLVVAADRNVAVIRSGQAARRSAGSLLALVTARLASAAVEGASTPLQLVTPPSARYQNGFQYIPSAFEVETILHKAQ